MEPLLLSISRERELALSRRLDLCNLRDGSSIGIGTTTNFGTTDRSGSGIDGNVITGGWGEEGSAITGGRPTIGNGAEPTPVGVGVFGDVVVPLPVWTGGIPTIGSIGSGEEPDPD
jgi:hypothetical protein